LEHGASVKNFVSLQFLDLRELVGLLGWGISPAQGRYLHRTTQNKRSQISMHWVRFEPKTPAFVLEKTFHALDRASTVIGNRSNKNNLTISNRLVINYFYTCFSENTFNFLLCLINKNPNNLFYFTLCFTTELFKSRRNICYVFIFT
jgi:hypothetical protein